VMFTDLKLPKGGPRVYMDEKLKKIYTSTLFFATRTLKNKLEV